MEREDAGAYVCKATNGFGSLSVNYTLIVTGEYPWQGTCWGPPARPGAPHPTPSA